MTKLIQTGPSSWLFKGELTFATVAEMLNGNPETNPAKPVIVDLSGLTRGDSAGLSLLIEWLAAARASGGELRYTGLPENFAHLTHVAGLDSLIANVEQVNYGLERYHPADGFSRDLAL